jgi:hypothetical protein
VATAAAERLAAPDPRDRRVLADLPAYRGLDPRWQDWSAVTAVCRTVADLMLDPPAAEGPGASSGPRRG